MHKPYNDNVKTKRHYIGFDPVSNSGALLRSYNVSMDIYRCYSKPIPADINSLDRKQVCPSSVKYDKKS